MSFNGIYEMFLPFQSEKEKLENDLDYAKQMVGVMETSSNPEMTSWWKEIVIQTEAKIKDLSKQEA
jgi:hypothetical protein